MGRVIPFRPRKKSQNEELLAVMRAIDLQAAELALKLEIIDANNQVLLERFGCRRSLFDRFFEWLGF